MPPAGVGSLIVLDSTAFQLGLESLGIAGYLIGLFLYSIAAAVILPIPVEFALLAYPQLDTSVKAVVLGLGKAAGAIVVFYVGYKVNPRIERWMRRHAIVARILKALEGFVRRTGWIGLTLLLALPFMSDTAVNYFYSLLNEEGQAIGRWHFVLANLVGGIARSYLFLWLLHL
jgi:membrane protein YqaA with SNARE-associated domain